MTWLVENPLPILLLGVAAEAVLVVVLFQTGRAATLLAMGGVALVTAVLLVVEWLVVTDVEHVESTLYAAAAAVQHNDVATVLEHVAADAQDVRRAVTAAFAEFEIVEARITSRPDIRFNRLVDPPTAAASFFGRIRGRPKRGGPADGPPVGRFTVDLVGEGPRWTITAYQLAR